MKQLIVKSVLIAATVIFVTSCNKKETATAEIQNPEVMVQTSDSLVHNDSINLGYDSATVNTAVDVKDEEHNAIKDEKADAEKLKKDEQHEK